MMELRKHDPTCGRKSTKQQGNHSGQLASLGQRAGKHLGDPADTAAPRPALHARLGRKPNPHRDDKDLPVRREAQNNGPSD